jgi:hypothetical protein
MNTSDAKEILTKFSAKGVFHKGRKYFVKEFQGKKGKNAKRAAPVAAPRLKSPPAPQDAIEGIINQTATLTIEPTTTTIAAPVAAHGPRFNQGPRRDARPQSYDVVLKNLAYQAADQDLRRLFNDFKVTRITIKSGIAFVGLPSVPEQQRAIRQLNQRRVLGRLVTVEASRPRK